MHKTLVYQSVADRRGHHRASGRGTLGRIMDVLGNPIDERGPVGQTQERLDPAPRPHHDGSRPHRTAETGIR